MHDQTGSLPIAFHPLSNLSHAFCSSGDNDDARVPVILCFFVDFGPQQKSHNHSFVSALVLFGDELDVIVMSSERSATTFLSIGKSWLCTESSDLTDLNVASNQCCDNMLTLEISRCVDELFYEFPLRSVRSVRSLWIPGRVGQKTKERNPRDPRCNGQKWRNTQSTNDMDLEKHRIVTASDSCAESEDSPAVTA